MTMNLADSTRNAMLDAFEADIGVSPLLEIFTGAKPANCAAGDTGTKLASMTLPSDWMAAASTGSKAKLGTWEDLAGDAAGDAGYYRIKTSGAVCKAQGSITATGGGGDMTLDNINIAVGQKVTVTGFTLTAGPL